MLVSNTTRIIVLYCKRSFVVTRIEKVVINKASQGSDFGDETTPGVNSLPFSPQIQLDHSLQKLQMTAVHHGNTEHVLDRMQTVLKNGCGRHVFDTKHQLTQPSQSVFSLCMPQNIQSPLMRLFVVVRFMIDLCQFQSQFTIRDVQHFLFYYSFHYVGQAGEIVQWPYIAHVKEEVQQLNG